MPKTPSLCQLLPHRGRRGGLEVARGLLPWQLHLHAEAVRAQHGVRVRQPPVGLAALEARKNLALLERPRRVPPRQNGETRARSVGGGRNSSFRRPDGAGGLALLRCSFGDVLRGRRGRPPGAAGTSSGGGAGMPRPRPAGPGHQAGAAPAGGRWTFTGSRRLVNFKSTCVNSTECLQLLVFYF